VSEGAGKLTRRTLLQRSAIAGAATLGAGGLHPTAVLSRPHRPHPRGRRSQPLGTELEYYRSDPAHLEGRLDACVAAGYDTVQTYVPWNVHENTRGTLDFTGQTHPVIVGDHVDEYQIETPDQEIAAAGLPSRVIANTDLKSFVEACARRKLKLILRPGPFISDEWRNGGLPDWLLLAYPDMFQLGPHGTALEPGLPFAPPAAIVTGGGPLYYFAGPSYASSDYEREAVRWMREFARWARPYLTSSGGPITSMQVDDEICFYYRFGPFEVDYHPEMLARFGAPPPTGWPAPGGQPSDLLPALRWQRFKAQQLGVWLKQMADALRAGGADVPISHEQELQLTPPCNFSQLAAAVDVLHPEFYLDPGPWSQPTLELCAAAIRAAQRQRRTVISAEMSQSDVFIRHLLLGEGIAGFLGFSYTQGIPDDAVGDMRTFARAVRLAGPRLASFERVADAAIVWCPEHLYTPYDSTRYGFARDVRNLAERDAPALATLLIRAGISFDLLDTDVAQPADYRRYPAIWLAATDVLPRSCQRALVQYVRHGGRLICWAAPPTLDEDYQPCTILRDQLYNQPLGPFYSDDAQTIEVLGSAVTVWRGVQTYRPGAGARVLATRGSEACGYQRRVGRGTAILLGTWPAADSVPGREGDVFQIQSVPSGGGGGGAGDRAAVMARDMTAHHWGQAAADQLPTGSPPGAGAPQQVIVFDYSNERRGGEVITGGTVAYWDGENVVPTADINFGTGVPEVTTPPFRPITPEHLRLARRLQGRQLACDSSHPHVQARLLVSGDGDGGTVSAINRYDTDADVVLRVRLNGQTLRLPSVGTLRLPAGSALLLPVHWTLAARVVVRQATVQLLDASVRGRTLTLAATAPAGGELTVELPSRARSAGIDGRRVPAARRGRIVRLAIPAGGHTVALAW